MMRMRLSVGRILGLFVFLCAVVFSASCREEPKKEPFTVRSEPAVSETRPEKPVKIKLRRLSDGKYTWEITGMDSEEVARADRELREKLTLGR